MMHTRNPTFARRRALLTTTATVALALTANTVTAQTATNSDENAEDVVTLSAFTVESEKGSGYRATNSIAATRSNTPIKDVPLNIQVFTQDLYEDLLITNQTDLEAYNASLVNGGADHRSSNAIQQAYNNFIFRGFIQNWGIRDGLREYDPIDTQGLARVEVIKGPAAPLYGLAYPGGIMNNITKQVDFSENFTDVRLTAASFGENRATIDANYSGEVGGGKFGVRFNAAHTTSKDERAHSEGSIKYTQAQLAWQPTPTTQIEFLAERGYREKPNGLSYFATGEVDAAGNALGNQTSIPLQEFFPEISYEWNWSDGVNMRSLDTKLYRGKVTQAVGENLVLSAYLQYSARKQIDGDGWDANGSGGADSWEAGGGWLFGADNLPGTADDSIQMGYSYRDWANNMHAYGVTGVYKLDFDSVQNTFTFGANVWGEHFRSRSHTQANSANKQTREFPIQQGIAINPSYAPPTDVQPITDGNGYTHETNSNDYYFASWQMAALDNRLKINASVNRTNLNLLQWANGQAAVPAETDQSKTSPMVGAMYDITDEISIYAVTSSSLFPETTKDSFGTQMPPQVGKGQEIGIKTELMEGKLSGTVSLYQINQTGGFQVDGTAENLNTSRWDAMTAAERAVAFPGQTRGDLLGDNVPGAKQESTGYELDLIYQPNRNWQILFSYANNDQEVVEAINTATIGQSTSGHVDSQFSILTRYSILDGTFDGLWMGLGVHRADGALQDYNGPGGAARFNPSTLRAEVFAGYSFKFFDYDSTLQLNVKNITRQEEFFGWQATGSAATIATKRYEIPTKMRFSLTWGLEF
ncbi:TonB-dependent siderophore receptor [Synoicihabitans lomoniglobus]|uniref:TonB-dependent receptor n=1 Tax=Synoicihabitans lomoniglobus TaxID=2909285 RepID=A0AAE9ZUZ1_9BACT|nr:TonB-dependent receptor [Opitutaceae bacterium LMO-M01]WED63836.1 TonB-dependent receptor [Opitutaceae bacterium LMO-M01]